MHQHAQSMRGIQPASSWMAARWRCGKTKDVRIFLVRRIFLLAPVLLAAAYGQTAEFEVASIKINPPQGFHFASDAVSGGPGTADPGMFRCSKCSLATLILKAFNLQPYQFPGRTSLNENTYDVMAKIPAGATAGEFSTMQQNLLKDRFGLAWHFQEKKMKGYHLVVGKDGPKMKESSGGEGGEAHSHSGAMNFGSSASFRGANKTIADLARVLSDQLGVPVDDQTGLTGKYDVALRWAGDGATHVHMEGGGRRGSDAPGAVADPSGPTLFDAVQQQLGLRLVPAEQAVARLLVVDKVSQRPSEN